MNNATKNFLEKQKDSAHNPLGSHEARSRGICIKLARSNPVESSAIADEIDGDLCAASNVSGFHPDSCHRLAAWLRDWRKAL